MEKINNIIKKLLTTTLITITIVIILSLNVAAQLLYTSSNPAPYVLGNYYSDNFITSDNQPCYIQVYPYNYAGEMYSQAFKGNRSFIGIWNSNIKYDTIYKITLDLNISKNDQLETGLIPYQTDTFFGVVPAMFIYNKVNMDSYGRMQDITLNYFDEYALNQFDSTTNSTFPTYHMFYDATSQELSVIFCVLKDAEYIKEIQMFDNYLWLQLGKNTFTGTTRITLTEYSGLLSKDTYTDVLHEISDKLDNMLSGGGLTEEQVNQAVQDALTAHDNQLEQEVSGKLDLILEQISGITDPYKQAVDQITGALNNVSNIFAANDYDSKLTLPAATNPLAGNAVLWQAQEIDLGAAYLSLPSTFRALLQYTSRAAVLIAALREVINIIKYAIIGRGEQVD